MARRRRRPRRAVAALRHGTARLLRRVAESLEPPRPAEPVRVPGSPPEHWLRLVAEHAPGLLRGLGVVESREAIARLRQPPLLSPPARVSPSFLEGVPAAQHPRPAQDDSGPAPAVHTVHAEFGFARLASAGPPAEPEMPLRRPVKRDVDSLPGTDRARWLTAQPATQSGPAAATATPAVAAFGPANRSGGEPTATPPPAVRPVADPWPALPGAVISRAGLIGLPAAIRHAQPSRPAAPARLPHIDQPTTVGRAVLPPSAPGFEVPVAPSPWPELPGHDETWDVPRLPSDSDRIARLAREQAGG